MAWPVVVRARVAVSGAASNTTHGRFWSLTMKGMYVCIFGLLGGRQTWQVGWWKPHRRHREWWWWWWWVEGQGEDREQLSDHGKNYPKPAHRTIKCHATFGQMRLNQVFINLILSISGRSEAEQFFPPFVALIFGTFFICGKELKAISKGRLFIFLIFLIRFIFKHLRSEISNALALEHTSNTHWLECLLQWSVCRSKSCCITTLMYVESGWSSS